ncbi:DUF2147 domain-containing protein [Asaia lannensis]|uniref:DUF2147 domain-containing protein n=1 Tax=Asaia lannensis TaxID=415421 RepID=UPI00387339C6
MKAWIFPRYPGSTTRTRDQGAAGGVQAKRGFLVSLALFASMLLVASPLQAQTSGNPPAPEEGLWLSQDHDGVFQIGHCGDTLCGRLIGMQYDGPVPKDVWGRSQCGLVMLTDFRLIKDENVWRGHILDPETGRTYDARINTESPEVLKLRGFILGIPLFGKTQTWTRYHGTIGPECKLP